MQALKRFVRRARLAGMVDGELVELAIQGDRLAFGELYQRYVNDVFAYVKLRVRDHELAEDLTQDVFLTAFDAMPRFSWQGHIRPWLLRNAHNRIANHWRSEGRRPEIADLPDDEGPGPRLAADDDLHDVVALHFDTEDVRHAMGQLTDLQREVIALRFGNELSVAETAEVMARSEGAVTNLQYYALAKLRWRLGAKDGSE